MEKAAKECQPAERPAMLRRWLAALRMQSGEEAIAEGAAAAAAGDNAAGGDDPSSAGAPTMDGDSATPPPASGPAAATGGGSPGDQDWDSLNLEKSESRDAAQAGAEQDSAASGGAAGSKYGLDDAMRSARLCFYEEGSEEPLSFRDVILRSRSLEHLVNSYVATPSVRREADE